MRDQIIASPSEQLKAQMYLWLMGGGVSPRCYVATLKDPAEFTEWFYPMLTIVDKVDAAEKGLWEREICLVDQLLGRVTESHEPDDSDDGA